MNREERSPSRRHVLRLPHHADPIEVLPRVWQNQDRDKQSIYQTKQGGYRG